MPPELGELFPTFLSSSFSWTRLRAYRATNKKQAGGKKTATVTDGFTSQASLAALTEWDWRHLYTCSDIHTGLVCPHTSTWSQANAKPCASCHRHMKTQGKTTHKQVIPGYIYACIYTPQPPVGYWIMHWDSGGLWTVIIHSLRTQEVGVQDRDAHHKNRSLRGV